MRADEHINEDSLSYEFIDGGLLDYINQLRVDRLCDNIADVWEGRSRLRDGCDGEENQGWNLKMVTSNNRIYKETI